MSAAFPSSTVLTTSKPSQSSLRTISQASIHLKTHFSMSINDLFVSRLPARALPHQINMQRPPRGLIDQVAANSATPSISSAPRVSSCPRQLRSNAAC
mmetsp:Transcript_19996/g.48043  ORF Transcript_19996/g.48043 Transcript_19996/m.48043 type:complete len:98 (+) Transcript_19996:160-453(+)